MWKHILSIYCIYFYDDVVVTLPLNKIVFDLTKFKQISKHANIKLINECILINKNSNGRKFVDIQKF